MDKQFAEVNQKMDKQFAEVNQKFAEVNQKFSEVNQRLDKVDERLTKLEVGQADIRGEIRTLDERISGIGKRLDNQEFLNRGVMVGLLVGLLAGVAKAFGWLPPA